MTKGGGAAEPEWGGFLREKEGIWGPQDPGHPPTVLSVSYPIPPAGLVLRRIQSDGVVSGRFPGDGPVDVDGGVPAAPAGGADERWDDIHVWRRGLRIRLVLKTWRMEG